MASFILMKMAEEYFSQMRGTAKNTVGLTSITFSVTVSTFSMKLMVYMKRRCMYTENMRSAMWLSGKKDKSSSSSYTGMAWARALVVQSTLLWLSMAPLGGPVVPLV